MSVPDTAPGFSHPIRLASAELAPARTNWAGNLTFEARGILSPSSVDQVRELVLSAGPLKALGAAHSFNHIADTAGLQISLRHLDAMTLDAEARTVTVGAGVSYGQLAPWLDWRGYALHNLASLPHISVVGACATATHGSGSSNGNLSTAVTALEFVSGTGELVRLTRSDQDFAGAVVGLGALGVVTAVTLAVEPRFEMAQMVYEELSFDALGIDLGHGRGQGLDHGLEQVFAAGYSVSLFTDWQQHRATQAWVKRRVTSGQAPDFPDQFCGAKRQTRKLHPLPGHPAEFSSEQMGVPGPWYERLPHFRMEFTPSSGAELQTEYFVAREHGWQAIRAVEELRDRITPHLLVAELRTVAADALWLSMACERDSLVLHFTWKPDWAVVQHVLPRIEEKLAPFAAIPHWAKLFAMPGAAVRALYPRFAEFEALRERYDPEHRFENRFLERLFA